MVKLDFDMEYIGRLFTVIVFSVLSIAGFGFSLYLFLVAKTTFLYLIATAFLLLSIFSGFFNILASYWYYKSFDYERYVDKLKKSLKPMKTYPTVSVVMPTHDEEIGMIKTNVMELKKLIYPKNKMHIFVLNDSADPKMKKSVQDMCKKLDVTFIYKENNQYYKAGALNNFLPHSKDEFVAIFDADERLENKNFLMETLPFFQDKKIAYV
jgi:cellulose synthase/poly-beta-1,6-N-acetylglucosamine synthase-like glycosyltransferase